MSRLVISTLFWCAITGVTTWQAFDAARSGSSTWIPVGLGASPILLSGAVCCRDWRAYRRTS